MDWHWWLRDKESGAIYGPYPSPEDAAWVRSLSVDRDRLEIERDYDDIRG